MRVVGKNLSQGKRKRRNKNRKYLIEISKQTDMVFNKPFVYEIKFYDRFYSSKQELYQISYLSLSQLKTFLGIKNFRRYLNGQTKFNLMVEL